MPPRRTDPRAGRDAVAAALAAIDAGEKPARQVLGPAARFLLELLADRAPGKAVEVRVPPYAAVQCVSGPRHTRGTPPNVLETDAVTWIGLATGGLTWAEADAAGRLSASGIRADISPYLPVYRPRPVR